MTKKYFYGTETRKWSEINFGCLCSVFGGFCEDCDEFLWTLGWNFGSLRGFCAGYAVITSKLLKVIVKYTKIQNLDQIHQNSSKRATIA
jgi:hypothetical protein